MSTDIHIFVEVLLPTPYENKGRWYSGRWYKIGRLFKNPYYDKQKPIKLDKTGVLINAPTTDQPYTGSNYDLFALLADVRNKQLITPLSGPRGVPHGVSDEVVALIHAWGSRGHHHTHFTLKELLDYDWDAQKVDHVGYVNAKEYASFKLTGEPIGWCGEVGGSGVTIVSRREMEKLIDRKVPARGYFCKIKWTATCAGLGSTFRSYTIPELKRLAKNKRVGGPEHVRIILWFDGSY